MATNDPPSRMHEIRCNVFGRKWTTEKIRQRGGNSVGHGRGHGHGRGYDSSMTVAATFIQETIQPAAKSNNNNSSNSNTATTVKWFEHSVQNGNHNDNDADRRARRGHSQSSTPTTLSTTIPVARGPKNHRHASILVPTYIQRQAVEPPTTVSFQNFHHGNECGCNTTTTTATTTTIDTKKRSRFSNNLAPTAASATLESEMRIEGDSVDNIIDEIRSMTFGSTVVHDSTSLCLKKIREPSAIKSIHGEYGALLRDNNNEHKHSEASLSSSSSPLFDAFKDLIERRAHSWRRIRIHECSPWIVEVLLASPHRANIEELQLVGMRDDNDEPQEHEPDRGDRSISPSSSESESHSGAEPSPLPLPLSSPVATTPTIAGLVVSLLRNTNRLQKLVVKDCNLQNSDLVRIMDVLCAHPNHPESLEHLDLRSNRLTPRAIESILSIYLRSSLHSLKSLRVRQGIKCVVNRSIRDAILRSLRTNKVVLESIDVFDWDKSVRFFLDVNRAKRRTVFYNNDRFPGSLWPFLLEQAVLVDERRDPSATRRRSRRRQASVVYHMFRNGGPMLLQQQSHDAAPIAQ
eukprot:CAMPEP_0168201162 /NCGR_PEP_ID=MMETSP0139_2-20121125/23507_1 /TAXON_ID=44445 /ORGANISM="Pseudo-nitzschia australis, Strain 10249 10 AB" /LENGTH=574 /DNA_ID=CAMNT_0008126595 /DNA_START=113 /DNA_END=1837 /DNA_ORIENTATION=+